MRGKKNDLSLEDLLPHRGGMLLAHQVLEVDGSRAHVLFRVERSWPMADSSGVHPLVLVELAAQAAGVCNGWERIHSKGPDSNPMGWLVGVKKAEFFVDHLPFGAMIEGWAENTHVFANLREVSCQLRLGERLAARAVLQLFQAEEE